MWADSPASDRVPDEKLNAVLAELSWLRVMDGQTVAGVSNSVVWWPAARPARAGEAGAPGLRLADDLWPVYWLARTNGPRSGGWAAAIEIGNEPELHFTSALPDRMAATLKAAWWGLKTANPDQLVLMPSLAAPPGPYAELLAANEVGRFTDAWNFHHYGWAHDLGPALAAHRNFLKRHRWADRPLWLTELGFAEFPTGGGTPQETLLARQQAFFERTAVDATANGVAELWAFALTPYESGGNDYGLVDERHEPRPALRSYLEILRRLRQFTPRHRLRHRPTDEIMGWALERNAVSDEGRWWTVLATPHRRADFALPEIPEAGPRSVPRPAPASSLTELVVHFGPGDGPVQVGLFGEQGAWTQPALRFTVSAATNLHLLTAGRSFSVADCEWEPIPRPSKATRLEVGRHSAPSPVVGTIRPLGPAISEDNDAVAYRYAAALPMILDVRLHNFSDVPHRGRWEVEFPAGWQAVGNQRMKGRLDLAPLSEEHFALAAWPPAAAVPARRSQIRLTWQGRTGSSDHAAIQVAAAGAITGEVERIGEAWTTIEPGYVEWLPEAGEAGRRHRLARLEPGTVAGLILGIPARIKLSAEDVLQFRVRTHAPAREVQGRVELITSGREVFRDGQDKPLDSAWRTIQTRVGDAFPAFWSRVGRGDPTRARYVRLALFGLKEGDAVELTPVERVRPE